VKAILLTVSCLFLSVNVALAQCSPGEIRGMIKQGLSDNDIDRRCGARSAYPSWLSGTWERQGQITQGCQAFGAGCGPIHNMWKFEVAGNTLELYEVRDAYLGPGMRQEKRQNISNVTFTGKVFQFITSDSDGTQTHYSFNVVTETHMQGKLLIDSPGVYGLPPLRLGGGVTLRKIPGN